MTAKRIVYTRPDGGVSVVVPLIARREGESDRDWLQRVAKKTVPDDAEDATIMDAADLPRRDGLRNAWRREGSSVVVNMDVAREIRLSQIRMDRDQRLAALDGEEMRARGEGDERSLGKLLDVKRALRELPGTVQSDPRFAEETDPVRLNTYEPVWPE